MPATIKSSHIIPDQGVEYLVLVSGLGTESHLTLTISDAANRQTNIDAALTQLDNNDAAIQAYSTAHNVPIGEA